MTRTSRTTEVRLSLQITSAFVRLSPPSLPHSFSREYPDKLTEEEVSQWKQAS
ncbi:hypothetical protein [Trichormus variabilis]|uniref:hypothetical protein n=1 Tax=Anabaena variabilis TaxID=264691 RepID=UPI00162391E0|nr:hypothetical protein [Trichormus variabilis]MBC1259015.1 hypothetical protein [Trichormus variabilis V5]